MKPKAVVICPGRGTYNKPELGYIGRYHSDKSTLTKQFDTLREGLGQISIERLDAAPHFEARVHTAGDNASGLIYAASFLDSIDCHQAFDVIAVTGNSMGWYTTLAVAGACAPLDAFRIVNTMGSLMQERLIGGQLIYPFVEADWRHDPQACARLLEIINEINNRSDCHLAVSIRLGGMLVVAGDNAGLAAFENAVPRVHSRFPLRLVNHAAFHTSLQSPVAAAGRAELEEDLFGTPQVPMIDGRGNIWYPGSSSIDELRRYTLNHQITETYDFTAAIRVAARSFAPDVFVVLGPGETMGSAVAQSLIAINWQGLSCKDDFLARQAQNPVILSMGRAADRIRVTS